MAAVDLPLRLVEPGQLVVAPHDCYGGTFRLLTARAKRGEFELLLVDQTDRAALRAAFARKPRLFLIESPSNPLLRITDIAYCARLAKETGTLIVADNTFLSPALQNPISLGCDIVVHSTTKYINGHSDVVGGAVLCKDKSIGEELAWWANASGVTGAAFDSYMTMRGLRTLFPRIKQQQASAAIIAESLAGNENIAKVHYPGLPDHQGHELAQRQQAGFRRGAVC